MRLLTVFSLLLITSFALFFLTLGQRVNADPVDPKGAATSPSIPQAQKAQKAQGGTGLTFAQNRITVTTAPDAKKITVPYTFENKSNRTIKIARYDSACSCLSAKVKGGKLEYKPGEKGELKVDFELGNFSGFVEKTVLLWTTDDSVESPSSVLTVALTIPVLFELTPKTIFWEQNGTKDAKVFKIKVTNTLPIRIKDHSGTNVNFVYELKTIKDGWEYELVVTPKDVTLPAFGMIKLTTDSAIPRYQRQMAFVCVRRAVKPATSVVPAPSVVKPVSP